MKTKIFIGIVSVVMLMTVSLVLCFATAPRYELFVELEIRSSDGTVTKIEMTTEDASGPYTYELILGNSVYSITPENGRISFSSYKMEHQSICKW